MDKQLLHKHIKQYLSKIESNPDEFLKDKQTRQERTAYYQSWTKDKILSMSEEEFYEYISKLWAMLIWGNKKYVVDKLITDHGFDVIKQEIANLLWGDLNIDIRWDHFKKNIKGMGPAMMSELLCHVHPTEFMLWNRRALVGLRYLGVEKLPRYNYQLTGKRYLELTELAKDIAKEMQQQGIEDVSLLSVDYFIWHELQVEDNLSDIHKPKPEEPVEVISDTDDATSRFIHDEVKDKLADIGRWLGFESQTEIKVADGSKVDTVWQATIGNMGRVIYVFEVQTKGSIDSLILNLLKAHNNSAVQGIVAVSDKKQLEKIEKHAAGVPGLNDKLKYWDYEEVLRVHESLSSVNESINSLGLVPVGF